MPAWKVFSMTNHKAVASHDDHVAALLICEKTAAKLIGVSAAMLVAGRFRKRPLLPFVRVGSRAIRYRLTDINDFIDRNTYGPAPKCGPRTERGLDKQSEDAA
jgi:hypothetical protein